MKAFWLSAIALCGIWVVGMPWALAQEPDEVAASTSGDDDAPEKPADPLLSKQEQVAERFRELERLMLRMAELTAPTDPRRAALLRQAVAQSKERALDERFDTLVDLLKQERLSAVVKNQGEVHTDLVKLLELLLSEDRSKHIESEKERVREYLKRVNKIIKEQKSVQNATQRDADARELADRQSDLSDKTGKLADDLREENGSTRPAGENDSEAKEGDDSSDSESKEGDKSGEGKEGNSEKSDGEKSDGKDGEEKEKEGDAEKSEGKDSEDKENKEKDSEGKDGEKSEGKSSDGEKSEGEQSDGEAKPGEKSDSESKSGKPQDGPPPVEPPSPGQPQEGQPQDSPQAEQNPAQQRLEKAQQRMQEAQKKLEDAERDGAVEKQEEAIRELEQAKAELEEILRQLREEEMARTLAMLEARFRKMLDAQIVVYEGTQRLAKVPEADRDRDDAIEAGRLSRKEAEIVVEADKALTVLQEEGSAVAFPEAVIEIRDDMITVRDRLSETKVDAMTQGIEEDIIAALEEMITALEKAQKDMEQQQGQQAPPQAGGENETPLVDTLSELKMIRALQMRVNTRTQRYSEMTKTEQVDQPELLEALRRLAEREERIHKVTRDIVLGRNR